MKIQEALDTYKSTRFRDFFDEPPCLISEEEAFDSYAYWMTPEGLIIECGYAEHAMIIDLLIYQDAVDLIDEHDAELKGWIKSSESTYITEFPVAKPIQDILLMHFARNGNKLWLCGGYYEFRDPGKLERWLNGGEYEGVER